MPVTLKQVMRDMVNFPYELQMFCYHHLNGRYEEAQTYMEAYNDMQNELSEKLQIVQTKIENDNNIDKNISKDNV